MVVVPLGQSFVPAEQGTLFVPVVMSWNIPGVLVSWYSMGLTLPNPFEEVAWLIRAKMPAKVGAPAEVPPIPCRACPSLARKPVVQLVRFTGGVALSK